MHADKHQKFLILTLWTLQFPQDDATIIGNLKKEVSDGLHYFHSDKHQCVYNLALLFLIEMVRHAQSTQSSKLARLFLKKVMQLLLCSTVMQNI